MAPTHSDFPEVSPETAGKNVSAVFRITLLGAFMNLFLVILKFTAGFFGGSSVLIADAVHSLSDFLTDFAVLAGAKYWGMPADESHPHGHAKLESLVTLFIGAALAFVGFKLIAGAVGELQGMIAHPEVPRQIPGVWALTAALISILVKEFLYRITARVGRRIRSSAVIANAWHHRTDSLSSIPAALAVGGCLCLGNRYAFLDPAGALVVGAMILYAAWMILYPACQTLMDAGASEMIVQKIEEKVSAVPGASNPHKIRTRSTGHGFEVDLHVWVEGEMTVFESHRMAHAIERVLKSAAELDILDVFVHIEPKHFPGEEGEEER